MKVEFYVRPDSQPVGRLKLACQLAAKAWRAGLPVFVRGADAAQCVELDELLWRFKGETFIPHNLHDEQPDAPVVIGIDQPPATAQAVLINLHPQIAANCEQFSRIIEIVNQQPEQLELARDNFRLYRQRGYAPQRVEL
ncbi:MAG: DNA polymerase III subunit chi [Pseudomonadaceae bacterium]|nr:DNA polymerase III subunit chi [Pseudomonadaceae bacterium]